MTSNESLRAFRIRVIRNIMNGRAHVALRELARYYGIKEPDIRVGTVKAHRRVLACYVQKEKRIYVSKSDLLTNPFVILHEFYHHMRASQAVKRGQVEKYANSFVISFIRELQEASVN